MDATEYIEILEEVAICFWKYATGKEVKKWFQGNNVPLIEWPAQSPDLNHIEILWLDVNKNVSD